LWSPPFDRSKKNKKTNADMIVWIDGIGAEDGANGTGRWYERFWMMFLL